MKKIIITVIMIFSMCLFASTSFATSVIDINGLTEEEIERCKKISDEMGIPLRVRKWIK